MGITDGAGIHGTSEVASLGTRRLARLRSDGRPRRRGALRPGPGRHPDLHRLRSARWGAARRRQAIGRRGEAHRHEREDRAAGSPAADELELSPAWRAALEAYARELAPARRVAARPCAPTAATCSSSAPWATGRGREPGELAYRDLRAYAAALSERRSGAGERRPASSPRRAAFTRHLVASGRADAATPPTCCRAQKRDSRLPRVLARDEVARAARPDPGPRRRSRSATGRCSSSPTRAGCAPRRSSRSTSATPTSSRETLRVTGKGSQDPRRADRRAGPARAAPLSRDGAPRARAGAATSTACSSRAAGGGCRLRRAPAAREVGPRGGGRRAASRRTRCGTRSPPICSRAAPTCARSRSSWATRASRRRRSTRGSSRRGCAASTQSLTRAPERAG